jgi:hypothetical protein
MTRVANMTSRKPADSVHSAIAEMDREVYLLSELERQTVTGGTALEALRTSWDHLLGHLSPSVPPTFPWDVHEEVERNP